MCIRYIWSLPAAGSCSDEVEHILAKIPDKDVSWPWQENRKHQKTQLNSFDIYGFFGVSKGISWNFHGFTINAPVPALQQMPGEQLEAFNASLQSLIFDHRLLALISFAHDPCRLYLAKSNAFVAYETLSGKKALGSWLPGGISTAPSRWAKLDVASSQFLADGSKARAR